jgi:hypothetical protein
MAQTCLPVGKYANTQKPGCISAPVNGLGVQENFVNVFCERNFRSQKTFTSWVRSIKDWLPSIWRTACSRVPVPVTSGGFDQRRSGSTLLDNK